MYSNDCLEKQTKMSATLFSYVILFNSSKYKCFCFYIFRMKQFRTLAKMSEKMQICGAKIMQTCEAKIMQMVLQHDSEGGESDFIILSSGFRKIE